MKRLWRAALVAGAALAVPAAINLAIDRQRRRVQNALPGDRGTYSWPQGEISYQARGVGRPLVLVHGIGVGQSSYEWRHNFDTLSDSFHVFAPDLPGFGQSERRDTCYTAALYVDALVDFLRDVVQEPACVVASAESCAFVSRAAQMRPELIDKLVFVCPTGLEKVGGRPPLWSQISYGALSLPAIGASIYNGISSYTAIESTLRNSIYMDLARVTPALVDHYYRSAHQPGAQYAIRSYVAGLLSCDQSEIYPELQQPILLAWGRYARPAPVENAGAFVEQNENAQLHVFERSGMLPHDEEAEEFNARVLEFLSGQALPAPPERTMTELFAP